METTTPQNNPVSNSQQPYPIKIEVPYPEKSSRLLAVLTLTFFLKILLLLPHLIILYFLSIFSMIAAIIGQFGIIIFGKYPRNLFALVKAMTIWQYNVNAYIFGLTDSYPPLAFEEEDRILAMSAIKKILLGILIAIVLIIVLIVLSSNQ